jgi:hypothetical protein
MKPCDFCRQLSTVNSICRNRSDVDFRVWVRIARQIRHPTIQTAYKSVMSLMHKYMSFAATVSIQHARHVATGEDHQNIPLDYASYQIDLGRFEEAIETLEQGRAYCKFGPKCVVFVLRWPNSQIQGRPGLEGFLKAPSFTILRSPASRGAVILISHCQWRSDILILFHNSLPCTIPTTDDFYAHALASKS